MWVYLFVSLGIKIQPLLSLWGADRHSGYLLILFTFPSRHLRVLYHLQKIYLLSPSSPYSACNCFGSPVSHSREALGLTWCGPFPCRPPVCPCARQSGTVGRDSANLPHPLRMGAQLPSPSVLGPMAPRAVARTLMRTGQWSRRGIGTEAAVREQLAGAGK